MTRQINLSDEMELIIVLDNGNEVLLESGDSSTIRVTNITKIVVNDKLGLMICPVSWSSIDIIPEG